MNAIIALLALFVACAYAQEVDISHKMIIQRLDGNATTALKAQSKFECTVCLDFVSESLQNLIEIIANVGISGGCGKVCGLLPSPTLSGICGIVCEILGIEEFAKLLNEADPDPIYICEVVNFCPHSTTAAANITNLSISPKSGQQGATFTISFVFQVTNTIATGELMVVIVPPDAQSFGSGETIYELAPGSYSGQLQFQAQPSEQEPFDPGQYQTVVAVCEGSCGSIHKWSSTLSERQTTFQITQ